MDTDEELYARFLCGEDDALRLLIERHMRRLTLFCLTFVHDVSEAEEAALDAFAVAAMKNGVWRGGSFQRWLYRVARNLSVSRFRRMRDAHVPFDEAHQLAVSGADADYWRREERRELLSLLSRLPEDERRVLTLLYLEGASYAQAAQALALDKKRIDNLAYRGKKRLREWLQQEG